MVESRSTPINNLEEAKKNGPAAAGASPSRCYGVQLALTIRTD
jgi:hypothetical protein